MNKSLKKIISLTVAFSAITSIVPSTLNFGIVRAEATEKSIDSNYEITDIDIKEIRGSSLKIYDDKDCRTRDRIDIDEDGVPSRFYTKIDESKRGLEIREITVENGRVEIESDGKEYDEGDEIRISEGRSKTIDIKVYDDSNNLKSSYSLRAYREEEDDDDDDGDNDDNVYLDHLDFLYNWNEVDFEFDKYKKEFNLKLRDDMEIIRIEAEPEDEDDDVSINGEWVDEDDDWQRKISLNNLEDNKIRIVVRNDDDDEREYVINVVREGNDDNQSDDQDKPQQEQQKPIVNKWVVRKDGNLTYYDQNGVNLKDQWYLDNEKYATYYFDNEGNPLKGMQVIGEKTYYFDNVSGVRQTGWINLNKTWYNFGAIDGSLIK